MDQSVKITANPRGDERVLKFVSKKEDERLLASFSMSGIEL